MSLKKSDRNEDREGKKNEEKENIWREFNVMFGCLDGGGDSIHSIQAMNSNSCARIMNICVGSLKI